MFRVGDSVQRSATVLRACSRKDFLQAATGITPVGHQYFVQQVYYSELGDPNMIYRTRRSSTTTVPSATPEVKLVRTLLHIDQLQHCPQSYLMSHKCPACLQVGWNEVPLPVLNLILQDMTAKEMWAVRAVGNNWAKAVRSTIEFALTIQATDRNLKAKMSAICLRQMHYPLAQFVLQLKGSSFQRSANLLLSVTKLVSRLLLLLFRFSPAALSCHVHAYVCN